MTKCPACGFDSADDAAWCDFCKEPFRKGHAHPEPPRPGSGPPPDLPPPAPTAFPIDPATVAAQTKRNGKPVESIDLKNLDGGERIPAVPPWARMAAWAFLAVWLICGMLLLGYYAAKEP